MGQLTKTAIDTMSHPGNAGSVSIATMIAGGSVWLEMINPFISFFAMVLGGVLSSVLIFNALNRGKLDRKLARLQREAEHVKIDIEREELKKLRAENDEM